MMRYADPSACPACRAPIVTGQPSCTACDTPLRGVLASDVFQALARVDHLVGLLRASTPVPAPAAAPAAAAPAAAAPVAAAPGAVPLPPPAGVTGSTRPASGLAPSVVPKILLGLGAVCLLVAALVFLAVAWALLGVGGRTVVLVLLTATCGALAAVTAQRDLRGGAEAFASVALGLVVLDTSGAIRAGWLGDPDWRATLLLVGSALTGACVAAALAARHTRVRRLLAPELFVVPGVAVAGFGLAALVGGRPAFVVGLAVATLAVAALLLLGMRVAAGTTAGLAVLWWAALVVRGVIALGGDLSIRGAWLTGDIWLLVVASLAPVPLALLPRLPRPARVTAASVAVAVGTFTLTVVAYDESLTLLSLVELAVVAAAVGASALLPRPWRALVVAPALAAGLALTVSGLRLAFTSLDVLLPTDAWEATLTGAVGAPDLTWTWPLLLPASAAAVAGVVWVVARCAVAVPARPAVASTASAVTLGAALVSPLYDVPLVVALLVLAGCVVATISLALGLRRPEPLAAAGLLVAVLLVASLANPWSTAITLGILALASGVAAFSGRTAVTLVGGALLPPCLAGFLWTAQHLAGVPEEVRAVLVLLALGGFLLARPGIGRELPAGAAGLVTLAAAVAQPEGLAQGWLAVHLTIAGAALTAVALVHEQRRRVGWAGLALLTLAQWVRLEQLGIGTVEAYTLPLGVALLALGLLRMRRTPATSTRALSAGLTLCLVPSLLLVLVDPVTLRALLLGLGCAAAITWGALARWSAPLVAGAGVALLLVLREALHASFLPQWLLIGFFGLALTLAGVTWERRLAELQAAAAYVRRMR